jgi:hypothetical protein
MADEKLIPSILTSVKKNLNIPADIEAFDSDILFHLNSVFSKLTQLGVGPTEGFLVEDANAVWDDFYTGDKLNMIKTYVFLEVRLLFDPPASSVLTSMEKTRDELVWRLNVEADKPIFPPVDRTVQNEN